MKKILIVVSVVILAVIALLIFLRWDAKRAAKQNVPLEDSAIQIPDFDSNDYLDQALQDLEALEGLVVQ